MALFNWILLVGVTGVCNTLSYYIHFMETDPWWDSGRRAYSSFLEKQLIYCLCSNHVLDHNGVLAPFLLLLKQECSCWPEVQLYKWCFHRVGKRFISRVDIISVTAFSLLKFRISSLSIKDLKLSVKSPNWNPRISYAMING